MFENTHKKLPAWIAPVGLLTALIVTIIFQLFITGTAALFTGKTVLKNPPPVVSILGAIAQNVAFILVALSFTRLTFGRIKREIFGLKRPNFLRAFLAVCCFGFMMLLLAFSTSVVGKLLGQTPENTDRDLLNDLGVHSGTLTLVGATFAVCVAAPIAEEFFFRGYFFQALSSKMHFAFAALITALVFGALHIPNFKDAGAWQTFSGLYMLTILGFSLCVLTWFTKSLYPAIVVHATNNCLAFSAALHWSWQIPILFIAVGTTLALIFKLLSLISPSRQYQSVVE